MTNGIRIENVTIGSLNTKYGTYDLYNFFIYKINENKYEEHMALVLNKENIWKSPVYFRINSACITSEVFGCTRCDCKWQLDKAIELIAFQGQGIITYHPTHEGRGFGLSSKLLSYNLMDQGMSCADSYMKLGLGSSDIRDYQVACAILDYFSIKDVIFLGNNIKKIDSLKEKGINVKNQIPLVYDGNNLAIKSYLTKKASEPEQILLKEKISLCERGM